MSQVTKLADRIVVWGLKRQGIETPKDERPMISAGIDRRASWPMCAPALRTTT